MIASLRGTVLRVTPTEILLDVNGVGYLVQVSPRLLNRDVGSGSELSLVIYTDVKENAIQLFGFQDWLEREVFLLTKTVKGIGPKHAMSIISALGPEGLLQAIGRRDIGKLQSVPGVGKKTAERLLVELREQVGELALESGSLAGEIEVLSFGLEKSVASSQGAPFPDVAASDAALALEKLGFSKDRARSAVEAALVDARKLNLLNDPGEILRLSLGHL